MNQTDELYVNMIHLTVRAKKHLSVFCESKHLTPVQGIVLITLEPDKTMTMNELSETMGCDASNITGLVDRLESHGLIKRCSCESDRRIKQISLSPKGVECRRDIVAALKKAEVIDVSKLSDAEKKELERLIKAVLS